MKRFYVFGFMDYYPGGGWNDYIDSFDTLDEAINCIADHRAGERISCDNYQVIDLTTNQEIYTA